MKIKIIFLVLFLPILVFSQKYKVSDSKVTFFSYAPVEDIKAESVKLQGLVDFSNKEFFFRIPINSFVFPSSLMQEHFNENYLESDLFPISVFKGTFGNDIDNIIETSHTWFNIEINGKLLIHGVEKDCSIKTELFFKGDKVIFSSQFYIQLRDFDIKIPKMFINNISEEIEIVVQGTLILLE